MFLVCYFLNASFMLKQIKSPLKWTKGQHREAESYPHKSKNISEINLSKFNKKKTFQLCFNSHTYEINHI